MQAIGAGLPRTGPMSMRAALNQLGYPCYHMQNVPRETGHLQAWDDAVTGRSPMDWQRLFQHYEAIVDAPGCFFYADLMRAYPEAKVVLTVRDPERWYTSDDIMADHGAPAALALSYPKTGAFFPFC